MVPFLLNPDPAFWVRSGSGWHSPWKGLWKNKAPLEVMCHTWLAVCKACLRQKQTSEEMIYSLLEMLFVFNGRGRFSCAKLVSDKSLFQTPFYALPIFLENLKHFSKANGNQLGDARKHEGDNEFLRVPKQLKNL